MDDKLFELKIGVGHDLLCACSKPENPLAKSKSTAAFIGMPNKQLDDFINISLAAEGFSSCLFSKILIDTFPNETINSLTKEPHASES